MMEGKKLMLAFLIISYIAASDAFILKALAKLAALKGLAIGFIIGRKMGGGGGMFGSRNRGQRGGHGRRSKGRGSYGGRGGGGGHDWGSAGGQNSGYGVGQSNGYGGGHQGRRWRRSADEKATDDQSFLSDDGCISKLICHLQFTRPEELSPQEVILLDYSFAQGIEDETITSYEAENAHSSSRNTDEEDSVNLSYISGVDAMQLENAVVDSSTREMSICEARYSSKCALDGTQLRLLLRQAWRSGYYAPEGKARGEKQREASVP